MIWCKHNLKDTKAMFPCSSQHSIASPKGKATPKKVKEILDLLGKDICDFDKYKVLEVIRTEVKLLLLLCKRHKDLSLGLIYTVNVTLR